MRSPCGWNLGRSSPGRRRRGRIVTVPSVAGTDRDPSGGRFRPATAGPPGSPAVVDRIRMRWIIGSANRSTIARSRRRSSSIHAEVDSLARLLREVAHHWRGKRTKSSSIGTIRSSSVASRSRLPSRSSDSIVPASGPEPARSASPWRLSVSTASSPADAHQAVESAARHRPAPEAEVVGPGRAGSAAGEGSGAFGAAIGSAAETTALVDLRDRHLAGLIQKEEDLRSELARSTCVSRFDRPGQEAIGRGQVLQGRDGIDKGRDPCVAAAHAARRGTRGGRSPCGEDRAGGEIRSDSRVPSPPPSAGRPWLGSPARIGHGFGPRRAVRPSLRPHECLVQSAPAGDLVIRPWAASFRAVPR